MSLECIEQGKSLIPILDAMCEWRDLPKTDIQEQTKSS
jgi:DNA-binding HxlR family transcriptional regulator